MNVFIHRRYQRKLLSFSDNESRVATHTIAVIGGHPYFTFSEKTEVLFTEQTYFTVLIKEISTKYFL